MLFFRDELVRKVVVSNRGKIPFFRKVFLIGMKDKKRLY